MIGYIHNYDGKTLTILAPFDGAMELIKKNVTQCEIRLDDGRRISADQRKKIYATIRDIAESTGHTPDQVKAHMKYDMIAMTGCDYFSLSDCDMTTANQFLEHLIQFCVEWDVPCEDNLLDRSPDIGRYVYMCLMNKMCCITGKKAELHHVDTVGAGRNRKTIIHEGMRVLPLCREMHCKAHSMGNKSFMQAYHLQAVYLDKFLCGVYRLRSAY